MPLTRRHLLKTAALAPLALSPLGLAACANRGSSSKSGSLNVGQISDSVAFFPLFIAEDQGYFTDESLSLGERPRLGTGAKVAAALKSGSIDLGGGVLTDALNLNQIDSTTRLTTSLVTEFYVDIVVAKGFDGPTGQASLEDKVKALRGKKIGITGPGSGTEALVNYLFGLVGADARTDSTLVNLGAASTSALGALRSKRVDALAFFQPIGQQAAAAGIGSTHISPAAGDVPALTGALHGVVFTRQTLLDAKSEEIASFNTAIGRSLETIAGDESTVRELLGKYLDGTPAAALDALLPILRKESAVAATVQKKPYDVGRSFHVDSGLVEDAPAYDSMVPDQFR